MNRKAIKAILKKKIGAWLESIEDAGVRELAKRDTIVTGGAIVNMLINEDVKDFDIYFKTKEATHAVAKYYVNKFRETHGDMDVAVEDDKGRIRIVIPSAGVAGDVPNDEPHEDVFDKLPEETEEEKKEKPRFRPVYLSSNAITLSDKIQIVVRFYGQAAEIHENYDFVHCTNYWTNEDNELVLRPEAMEAILNKELRYVGSKYPICSVIRARKFIQRGWKINAGQYLKMLFQVSKLNLEDLAVLEDQLVGVDSAYFLMLIDGLKTKMDSDPNFRIDSGYLATIIDKIF